MFAGQVKIESHSSCWTSAILKYFCPLRGNSSADPEGGDRGSGPPPPPGKSQVIWVSIGNKQLDPPWKKLDPPCKMSDPLWNLENDRFDHLTSVK